MIFGIGQKIKQVGNVCVHLVLLVLLLRTFFLIGQYRPGGETVEYLGCYISIYTKIRA